MREDGTHDISVLPTDEKSSFEISSLLRVKTSFLSVYYW